MAVPLLWRCVCVAGCCYWWLLHVVVVVAGVALSAREYHTLSD